MRNGRILVVLALVLAAWGTNAAEVGLVTAASDGIKLQDNRAAPSELKPFVKIREGDKLNLVGSPRLQVVYFDGGRQETWQGAGAIEVGTTASKILSGNLQPEVKILPPILVKQLSKTPAADGGVKTGMVRMRSITPPQDRVDTVEREYAEMRKQADVADRSPELYLLASYLELREFDRLDAFLRQMTEKSQGNPEIAALNTLYSRAVSEAKAEKK